LLKAPFCGGGWLTSEERGTSAGAALAATGASRLKTNAAAKAGRK